MGKGTGSWMSHSISLGEDFFGRRGGVMLGDLKGRSVQSLQLAFPQVC